MCNILFITSGCVCSFRYCPVSFSVLIRIVNQIKLPNDTVMIFVHDLILTNLPMSLSLCVDFSYVVICSILDGFILTNVFGNISKNSAQRQCSRQYQGFQQFLFHVVEKFYCTLCLLFLSASEERSNRERKSSL